MSVSEIISSLKRCRIKAGRNPAFVSIFIFLSLIFFPISLSAETTLSFFVAPSFPFPQDVKVREYDANQNLVNQNLLEANPYAGIEIGTKFSYFFHKNFGAESQISYSRIRTDLRGTNSKFNNVSMRQERYSFLLSVIARINLHSAASPSPLRLSSLESSPFQGEEPLLLNEEKVGMRIRPSALYLGFGLGAVYSDFDFIPAEWGLGGKLFLGADFPLKERFGLFFETQYFWAPDVGGGNQSPGENLKTSGNPNYNFCNKLFGPHHDTQFLSLLIGTKFKL